MDYILIELILWIIVVIFLFFNSGLFLRKGLKDETRISRNFFYCVAFFFLLTGVQRLFSILFDFYYSESYFLLFLITLFNIISIIPLIFHLENDLIKTKRILSYSIIIMVAIYIIAFIFVGNDRELMYYFFVPPFLLAIGSVGTIYLYLVYKSSGQVRKNALFIVIGLVNLLIFWFLHSQFGRAAPDPNPDLIDIVGIISPIGILLGLSFLVLGFFNRKY